MLLASAEQAMVLFRNTAGAVSITGWGIFWLIFVAVMVGRTRV